MVPRLFQSLLKTESTDSDDANLFQQHDDGDEEKAMIFLLVVFSSGAKLDGSFHRTHHTQSLMTQAIETH